MPKPLPDPFDPEELPSLARKVIKEAKFPMLATIDGDQARLRPVSPVRVDGFTIYVANLRGYHKTAQIAANPNVELCYLSQRHDQVRITGAAHPLGENEQSLIGGKPTSPAISWEQCQSGPDHLPYYPVTSPFHARMGIGIF